MKHSAQKDCWTAYPGPGAPIPTGFRLQLEGIEHRKTKVRRPQSNGYVERLHRTLFDEHFRIMGQQEVL